MSGEAPMSDKTDQLKKVISEIESVARQLGHWEGNMMMCYVASVEAWNAGMVKPGDTSQRIELGKRLGKLFEEANQIIEEINY